MTFSSHLASVYCMYKKQSTAAEGSGSIDEVFNHQEGCCQPFRSIGSCVAP